MSEVNEETQLIDQAELQARLNLDSGTTQSLNRENLEEAGLKQRHLEPMRPSSAVMEPLVELLEGWRSVPYSFKHLPRLRQREVEGLRLMGTLLPGSVTRQRVGLELSEVLEISLESFHRVKWTGLRRVARVGQRAHVGRGYWTWATLPPSEVRCVMGIQWPVVKHWETLLSEQVEGGRHEVVSDVLAMLGGRLSGVCRWPEFDWAGEPVLREDIELMMGREEPPWMALNFSIKCREAVANAQLWMPVGALRHIGEWRREEAYGESGAGWVEGWSGLRVRYPVVLGSSRVYRDQLKRLGRGDILIVKSHGVDAEGLCGGDGEARWWLSEQRCVEGRCRRDGGRWVLEVQGITLARQNSMTGRKEVAMEEAAMERSEMGASALEVAESTVEIKIGEIDISLRELAKLQKGQVIACEERADAGVELMVGGLVVGRGELVTVDGRLGVRILGMNRPRS